jgi:hypothetical protein
MGILEQAQTRSVSLSRMHPFRIWMSLRRSGLTHKNSFVSAHSTKMPKFLQMLCTDDNVGRSDVEIFSATAIMRDKFTKL